MADDLDEFLRRWVEKSGRSMELRVARAFLRNSAQVEPSFRYRDPGDPSIVRECDVLAQYRWAWSGTPCLLKVCVEVKSSRDHPWVAFSDPDPRRQGSGRASDWLAYVHGPFNSVLESFDRLVGNGPFRDANVATHLVAAGASEKANQSDPAYDAIRQVISATEVLEFAYRDSQHDPANARGEAAIPVIVTQAPLFICSLTSEGEAEFRRVNRVDVWGHTRDGTPRRVFVCAEAFVDSLSLELRSAVDLIDAVNQSEGY